MILKLLKFYKTWNTLKLLIMHWSPHLAQFCWTLIASMSNGLCETIKFSKQKLFIYCYLLKTVKLLNEFGLMLGWFSFHIWFCSLFSVMFIYSCFFHVDSKLKFIYEVFEISIINREFKGQQIFDLIDLRVKIFKKNFWLRNP